VPGTAHARLAVAKDPSEGTPTPGRSPGPGRERIDDVNGCGHSAMISGRSMRIQRSKDTDAHQGNQVDQRARWRAARLSASGKVPSTRWVGAIRSVTARGRQSLRWGAADENDHQRGLPVDRHGTLPSDPQVVQPVTRGPGRDHAFPADTGHDQGRHLARACSYVHARYIASLGEVNHQMRKRASGEASSSDIRAPESCDPPQSSAQSGRRDAGSLHLRSQRQLRSVSAVSANDRRHVCSIVARLSRYGPVAAGTGRHQTARVAAQPGRVLALSDTRRYFRTL